MCAETFKVLHTSDKSEGPVHIGVSRLSCCELGRGLTRRSGRACYLPARKSVLNYSPGGDPRPQRTTNRPRPDRYERYDPRHLSSLIFVRLTTFIRKTWSRGQSRKSSYITLIFVSFFGSQFCRAHAEREE